MCKCCVNFSIFQIKIEFFNCCGKLVYLRNGFCCVQVLEGFVDEEKKGCGFVRDLVSGLSLGVREKEGEGGVCGWERWFHWWLNLVTLKCGGGAWVSVVVRLEAVGLGGGGLGCGGGGGCGRGGGWFLFMENGDED